MSLEFKDITPKNPAEQPDYDELMKEYMNLSTQFSNLQGQKGLEQGNNFLASNPLFEFDLNAQRNLNGSYQNYINLWNVRESQGGLSQGEQNLSSYSFLIYLLVLERAKYFKNRVIFQNVEDERLNLLLYETLFYASLNGTCGLYFTKKERLPILVNVSNKQYNLYGELVGVDIQPINYMNSVKWDYGQESLSREDCKRLAILKQNGEEFGLWVLSWFYLKKVVQYFNILNYQVIFLNKKLGVEYDLTMDSQISQIYQSLINPDVAVVMTPDLNKIKSLELPEIDVNKIFELIVNFQNYFDFHILGIRTKDLSPDNKSREIVANAGINSQQASKKEQSYSLYLESFLNKVNEITGSMIDYEDSNISLAFELINESDTKSKITEGNEGGKDE